VSRHGGTTAGWLWATVVVVAVVVGAGCHSSDPSAPASARTTPTLPANGAPTAAALAAVDGVHVAVTGTDCGGASLDAGWPTTAVFNQSVCLRDADRAHKQAHATYLGRTASSGAYRLLYSVDGRGALRISLVLADATGTLHREGWQCAVPQQPLVVSVELGDDRVVPSPVDASCRHLAT